MNRHINKILCTLGILLSNASYSLNIEWGGNLYVSTNKVGISAQATNTFTDKISCTVEAGVEYEFTGPKLVTKKLWEETRPNKFTQHLSNEDQKQFVKGILGLKKHLLIHTKSQAILDKYDEFAAMHKEHCDYFEAIDDAENTRFYFTHANDKKLSLFLSNTNTEQKLEEHGLSKNEYARVLLSHTTTMTKKNNPEAFRTIKNNNATIYPYSNEKNRKFANDILATHGTLVLLEADKVNPTILENLKTLHDIKYEGKLAPHTIVNSQFNILKNQNHNEELRVMMILRQNGQQKGMRGEVIKANLDKPTLLTKEELQKKYNDSAKENKIDDFKEFLNKKYKDINKNIHKWYNNLRIKFATSINYNLNEMMNIKNEDLNVYAYTKVNLGAPINYLIFNDQPTDYSFKQEKLSYFTDILSLGLQMNYGFHTYKWAQFRLGFSVDIKPFGIYEISQRKTPLTFKKNSNIQEQDQTNFYRAIQYEVENNPLSTWNCIRKVVEVQVSISMIYKNF
ncbi:MAG: hypothetical protein AAFO15_00070 [Pseudomonadota bacterium]